jgi:hypothetical protein
MTSSTIELVFISPLINSMLQSIFFACQASMNVDSKCSDDWNHSSHIPAWQYCLHYRIEKTCGPGISSIICHQVHGHPLEHGTSSMGKHLLATLYIGKLINV